MRKSTFIGNTAALGLMLSMLSFGIYFPPIEKLLPENEAFSLVSGRLLMFAIPMLLYFTLTKHNIKSTLFIKGISPLNAFIIFIMSLLIQPLLMAVSALSSILSPNAATEYFESLSSFSAFITLTVTSFLPAILEEIYFRGIVFSNYSNVKPYKAFVAVGFIFATAHLNIQQFFYAFIMGIIFCYFVYKTGSILSSIISHFTINGAQTLLSVLTSSASVSASAQPNAINIINITPLFLFAALSLVPFTGLMLIFRFINKNTTSAIYKCAEYEDEKIFNTPFILIIALFVYFIFAL